MINEKYRFDEYDKVYEYDKEQHAYNFIGKLNGRTKKQFIKEYEEQLLHSDHLED